MIIISKQLKLIHFDVGGLDCFYMNGRNHWLVVGTSFGVYRCLDLRFLLFFRSWRHERRIGISCLTGLAGCLSLFLAGRTDGSVMLWDIEGEGGPSCMGVFHTRCSDGLDNNNKDDKDDKDAFAWTDISNNMDDDFISKDLDSDETALDSDETTLYSEVFSVLSFPDTSYLLTCHSSGLVSHWDLRQSSHSYVVSGAIGGSVSFQTSSSQLNGGYTMYQQTMMGSAGRTNDCVMAGSVLLYLDSVTPCLAVLSHDGTIKILL